MISIDLSVAEPLHGDKPQLALIRVCNKLPEHTSLETARLMYKTEACALATALISSLPEATIHALIIELLQHKTCIYRGVSELIVNPGECSHCGKMVSIRHFNSEHHTLRCTECKDK